MGGGPPVTIFFRACHIRDLRPSFKDGEVIVVDGIADPKTLRPHETSMSDPFFSPDGSTFAYVASRGRKFQVVVGSEIGEKFSSVSAMTFSPDGKSVAYRAERFGKNFVVAGKALSEEFDAVVSGPFYSPDSKKVAFVVLKGQEIWSKVMDVK